MGDDGGMKIQYLNIQRRKRPFFSELPSPNSQLRIPISQLPAPRSPLLTYPSNRGTLAKHVKRTSIKNLIERMWRNWYTRTLEVRVA
jgi:hypothetical protein